MSHQDSSEQGKERRRGYIPAQCVRFIQNLQRRYDQGRPATNNENTYNKGIFIATCVIGLAGILGFLAALIQAFIFNKQLAAMKSTDEALHIAAIAAKDSASAAIAANETTRAQLSARLIIPDMPQSTIKVSRDGTVLVDLYIANTGQTWARDVSADVTLTIKGYPITVRGDLADVSWQQPSHVSITTFPKFPVSLDGNIPIAVTIKLAFTTIFKEPSLQSVNLVAGFQNADTPCCTIDQLEQSVRLLIPVTRGGPIGPRHHQ
jgi:hypothetical protein